MIPQDLPEPDPEDVHPWLEWAIRSVEERMAAELGLPDGAEVRFVLREVIEKQIEVVTDED